MASPTVAAQGQSSRFDEWDFRRSMNEIGRAYRNRAMELIAICRGFSQAAEQHYLQDAELTSVLRVCDTALSRAVEARKGSSPASEESFEFAIRELRGYESKHHSMNTNRPDAVKERMDSAKQKDERQSKKGLVDWILGKGTKTNTASLRVVEFHLMESLTNAQPTIVRQMLTNHSKPHEILWNFSRCGTRRLTLAENPHFYSHLPSAWPDENRDRSIHPIEHNWHTHPIYVLTNIPGRIFFECGPKPRAFDNVWSTNGTLIFKGVCGRLWHEIAVGKSLQGAPCSWCLVESELPPSQPAVELAVVPPEHAWNPAQDWREAIHQLLHLPNIKIRITENT